MLRSPSGLVADYVPTSQFWPGHTEDACSAFAAILNKHAGFPGHGTKTSETQMESEGLALYAEFFGNADASNTRGPDVPTFEKMLSAAGVAFAQLPDDKLSVDEISKAVEYGYAVIATIFERNVLDRLTGGLPYSWEPGDMTHIVTIAGFEAHDSIPGEDGNPAPKQGNYLVVDPANVVGQLQGANHTRPWPRPYDAASLQPIHAWIVAFPWMDPIPHGLPMDWADAEYQGDPTWTSKFQAAAASAMWSATAHLFGGQAPDFNTGIARQWQEHYRNGQMYGPPLCEEYRTNTWSGQEIIVQQFASGWCEWPTNGQPAKWYQFV